MAQSATCVGGHPLPNGGSLVQQPQHHKQPITLDSTHEDIIHDSQFDYYGKRLATCSSDKTVKVFEIDGESTNLVATLVGHNGPVWSVAWGHPKFGDLLASASYDGRVIVWKEVDRVFNKIYEHTKHSSSVNSIAWAPHEHGLVLACASSDGCVSILKYHEDAGVWDDSICFEAHGIGVNAVAWEPPVYSGSLGLPSVVMPPRLATGGSDNLIKIWAQKTGSSNPNGIPSPTLFNLEDTLQAHDDWVRDLAWAPNVGVPTIYLASCGQDKMVYIWTQSNLASSFEKKSLPVFPDVVWRVAWSHAGDRLAVSCGDNKVTLWRENIDGVWECISSIDE